MSPFLIEYCPKKIDKLLLLCFFTANDACTHNVACSVMQVQALRELYTLWYAAGNSLGYLPALPGWQKDVLPHLAIDLPVAPTSAIKDGRVGYTNGTLTWQVSYIPPKAYPTCAHV